MKPWGHAAVAYLAYVAYRRYRYGLPPGEVGALAVVFGSQIADLIDKPLAYWSDILVTGRELGHSPLVIVPAVALLWWWLGDDHPEAVGALALGWLTHPFADAVGTVLAGDWAHLAYFLWPVLSMPPYSGKQSFLARLTAIEPDLLFGLQLVLVAAAAVAWRHDDYPGLATVSAHLGAPLETRSR